jgi:dTDP-4-amino-4,6-dideoxygalactose transaminase
VIVTNSAAMDARLRLLRNHGLRTRDEVEIFGYNSRLDSLHAIVGNHLIKDFEAITSARIRNAERLDRGLAALGPHITLPPRPADARHVYHLYMVQARERDGLLRHLVDHGVEAKVHYPIPLHLQPAARGLGYKEGDFPITEAQARAIITYPVHQHLDDRQVDYMIETTRAFYR